MCVYYMIYVCAVDLKGSFFCGMFKPGLYNPDCESYVH